MKSTTSFRQGVVLWAAVAAGICGAARAESIRLETAAFDDRELAAEQVVSNVDTVSPSVFKRLEALFKSGKVPDVKKASGWWAGRSFYTRFNGPAAALLIGNTLASGRDDGPLFPSVPKARFVIAVAPGYPANHFDNPNEQVRKMVSESEANFLRSVTETEVGADEVTWKNIPGNVLFEMREATLEPVEGEKPPQTVLVTRLTILRTEGGYTAGELFGWSYFFKQVK